MKKGLVFIVLLIIMFCININVNAKQSAVCFYKYTSEESDFKFKNKQAALIAFIYYDNSKHTSPLFYHRIIKNEDLDLSDGFKKEFAQKRKTVIENAEEAVYKEKEFEEMDVYFLMDRFGYCKM